MKTYIEPECLVMTLDMGGIVCGSQGASFDAIDSTELFTLEDFELL